MVILFGDSRNPEIVMAHIVLFVRLFGNTYTKAKVRKRVNRKVPPIRLTIDGYYPNEYAVAA